MNGDEYAELAPAQIWARELDAGRYHCSVSTMYRILREQDQSGERRRQATHPAKTVPELVATGPSQVFTWDITKAAGPIKGLWYHAYVITDIFSRYIVGHTVERAESALGAEELIRETIARNGIVPQTVHADRGTSMTSKKVSQLLIDLGVTRSHSRPKVSNDNPYSEAQFKTTKYMSDYPERFDSLAHAREWFDAFIAYYTGSAWWCRPERTVVRGAGAAGQPAGGRDAQLSLDAGERLVYDRVGGRLQSALSEIISKSAEAFPITSSAALFRARSFCNRSTCCRSFSFSTSAADFFARAGLVRRSTRFSRAPASRAARHSLTCEW
ncbi:transposase [Streptomyces sp. NBC_01238]|uniref:transposase n=1 Tax=Streptomyces sp. NBC_01238 TaxID=2903791 RepID=UPI003865D3B4